MIPFLEEDENAILTLDFETVDGEHAEVLEGLQQMLSTLTVNGVPLKDMAFKYDHELWKDHDDWPTIDELRKANQRLVLFVDRSEIINPEYGIMHKRQVVQENFWVGIDGCSARYEDEWGSKKVSLEGNQSWTRLFFMNHFCCGSGGESYPTVVGEGLLGGGDNGW